MDGQILTKEMVLIQAKCWAWEWARILQIGRADDEFIGLPRVEDLIDLAFKAGWDACQTLQDVDKDALQHVRE